MIHISNPEECCGCTACASICSHDAISMQPDALGFLYPIVDMSKCTDCHLCEKVCAFNDHYDTSQNLPEPEFYGIRHKDINEIENSRSGAAFVALSDWILERGGIVYGAGYEEHFKVVHKRATTKEARDEFRGSKYVQSDLRGILRQVKKDLEAGFMVMFSGTPCQTAGLNSYIGQKLRKNLFLVDIVCHGVPAPNIWRDYLTYLENKQGAKIIWVNFRDKQMFGWAAHKESFKFANDNTNKKTFRYRFYTYYYFRPSCSICHFTNTTRPSDITLADFWGWEKTDPNFNADNKGASLVIINTVKGTYLFSEIQNSIHTILVKKENSLQPTLCHPTQQYSKRDEFARQYETKGFDYVLWQYMKDYQRNRFHYLKGKTIMLLRKIFKHS